MNEAVASLLLFAPLVTKLVDMTRNLVGDAPKWVWNLLAFGLGLAIAFLWDINALESVSETKAQGAFGQVVTGLAMGGASSGFHELFDLLSSKAKK